MKIASIIAAAVIAIAAAFYFSQPEPPCGDNIFSSNIVGCDIKGPAK
jgi:hypothetical protein